MLQGDDVIAVNSIKKPNNLLTISILNTLCELIHQILFRHNYNLSMISTPSS